MVKNAFSVASFCVLFWLFQGLPTWAQPAASPLVVMSLAAHPDDEDGSTLAYYRHRRNAVAYSVLYTRGEGGQNEIGPELYEELGAIRSTETERAARHLGTQVYFLNFEDFGYSKSADETFERWGGRDKLTSRLVYLIRKLKPDVLFTNHDTVTVGPGQQHGHHQAVGITAYEAFDLAADPEYHPDQLEEEGVDLWQPKRMFRRLWSRGNSYDVAVPVGDVDPELNVSYAELAARALGEHASQGMDMFARNVAGWDSTYFVLYKSATDAPLGEGDLAANLAPNRSAEPDVPYWIDSGRLPSLAAGSILTSDDLVVPGQRVEVRWDPSNLPARPLRLRFFGAADTTLILREDSMPLAVLRVKRTATPTTPSRIYQYERFRHRPPLGYAVYDVRGTNLLAGGYLDMEVAPPLLLEADQDVVRLKGGANVVPFNVRVFDPSATSVLLASAVSGDDGRVVLDQHQETLRVPSDQTEHRAVTLTLPASPPPGQYTVSLSAVALDALNGPASTGDFVSGRVFDVNVPNNLRVGVVESYDDALDRALTQLGVEHVMLDSSDLARGSFDDLHTVVVDIRAYLVRSDLRRYNDRLLDWVRRGGHVVVNYHKTFEWNPESRDPFDASRNNPANLAPYPIHIGRDRVTREDAPVRLLQPDHALFREPNPIREEDWTGWVQERGLYFPDEYDDRYVELLSLNDPGEEPLDGSTLLAHVGGGTYIYSALVWYRQLKEFHPGAYKIFANMISLPLIDGRYVGP